MREQRADARRNHELLVLAAREVFAEQGSDAPMEAVARRAGVGNATMYRHFATRHDLLLAVYADDIAVLCAQAHRQTDPFDWLWQVVEHLAGTRDIALAVLGGDYAGPLGSTARRLFADRGAEALVLAAGIALAPAARRARLFMVLRKGLSG